MKHSPFLCVCLLGVRVGFSYGNNEPPFFFSMNDSHMNECKGEAPTLSRRVGRQSVSVTDIGFTPFTRMVLLLFCTACIQLKVLYDIVDKNERMKKN